MTRILAMDEGTTNVKASIVDEEGKIISSLSKEFNQIYPKPGWVEHEPEEIWRTQVEVAKKITKNERIDAIGITNQRETVVVWDKNGKPIYNAIVWQCRRTADMMEEIKKEYGEIIREKTGLIADAYFSASKIKWLLDNVPRARERAKMRELMAGTIDSYLIYKLTGEHLTDHSNASRTMLFNIKKGEWDEELLELFGIPKDILPHVRDSSSVFGYTKLFGKEVPVSGVLGDQQAALFGQTCFSKGMLKVTYGTGNFLLANTGNEIEHSENLLTTVAWKIKGNTTYALEGSVFITGAALKWLKDLEILKDYDDSENLAKNAKDSKLFFVPAFSGLGSPYWDPHARGLLIGITRGTKKEDIVKATLDSIAYQTKDVVEEMKKQVKIKEIRVDGGASKNDYLMQFQSDILGIPVLRPAILETTSLGAAFMAGLTIGAWDMNDLKGLWKEDRRFEPKMKDEDREKLYKRWKDAVSRALGWAKE
ncbi:glycerol kinase GlpK [Candidatus Aciduliprofundum boonei]|uniref:Glycerol kinase n=1 Tax=Aciduliprofundum boonei (strain DSM 19572 / T469) TaxID=439481 RepID=B5ID01_ACIB4|nr:glycerol kinase GlpK [Candidatus Aciduliprofundum boonei]ADD09236.1 glycerol kinase [Aciduliprofundum boonei T469]EDY35905.1 glycerol kinase [Aciduliprofundum boonei T469]HII55800.1 glycerol kinase GlpK [Candidatus Aciduliprofundum boonei]